MLVLSGGEIMSTISWAVLAQYPNRIVTNRRTDRRTHFDSTYPAYRSIARIKTNYSVDIQLCTEIRLKFSNFN